MSRSPRDVDVTVGTPRPAHPVAATGAAFDVVALVSSAGGLDATSVVLRDLPADFPAAVLVVQHLGPHGSALVEILGRRAGLPVVWIEDGMRLAPAQVYVCPPRTRLEILPDATCALAPAPRGALDGPFDDVLVSLADSFGPRALAVVLTGMGRDGAAGARALREAGGTVLVQSEDTAEHPWMPRATIEAGGADLVLPLHEIGAAVAGVVAGGRLPRSRLEVEAAEVLFAGPGEVRTLLRAIEWPQTPLGPVAQWSSVLRTTLQLVLESPMPAVVFWGAGHVQLYNDRYRALVGAPDPAGLGQPARDRSPEVWHQHERVLATVGRGEPVAVRRAHYPITRHGSLEDAWFDVSYAPVRDEQGVVAAVLATAVETTAAVLAERRLQTLHGLGAAMVGAETGRAVLERAIASLATNAEDLPYALGYLLDATGMRAELVGATGVAVGTPMAPRTVDLRGGHPAWPLAKVVAARTPVVLDDLGARFRDGINGAAAGLGTAMLLPLGVAGDEPPAGVLVVGTSPRLPFTAACRQFVELAAVQVSESLGRARVRQRERERQAQMAELEGVKTAFFANVSDEFRTPLTQVLGPLDDLMRRRDALPGDVGAVLDEVAHNARRMLGLVDTLLDFARLEAGQQRAHFEPTDLAALTADVADAFRGAVERAGLVLRVDCPPLPTPVWVDRGMWERVVASLLSNALKFTFSGEITVELRTLRQHAALVVRDTGVGIPAAALPHLFERFHHVPGARGRTSAGVGIGLALVRALVRQHNGRVRVASAEGEGATFTVWVPTAVRRSTESGEMAPHPADGSAGRTTGVAAALADEAMRWDVPG